MAHTDRALKRCHASHASLKCDLLLHRCRADPEPGKDGYVPLEWPVDANFPWRAIDEVRAQECLCHAVVHNECYEAARLRL